MSEKRVDLQGLRGVAILLVLLFHLKPHLFSLGFIGVDMFFVLSGYLMTMILSKKVISSDVVSNFYARRFKRIVPLFGFILFMVYLVSWFYLISSDRVQLLTDLKWSLSFTSNIQPLFEIKGYWDQVNSYRFLVHCWSLGAEIQFYFVAPFIAGYCREQKWNFVIYILFFCSLFFQLSAPSKMAYGLLPSRVWQFLSGTIAYEIEQRQSYSQMYQRLATDEEKLLPESFEEKPEVKRESSQLYTIFRELLIVLLVVLVISNPPFIDETKIRLIGILLTTTYIFTANIASYTLLSLKPLVYIGDISYTLYLVHWPVIVFYKYYNSVEDLNFTGICWCLLIMFLHSIIIHHTIENFLLRSPLSYGSILFCSCIILILISSPYYQNDVQITFGQPEQRNESSIIQRAIAFNVGQDKMQAQETDINNPNRTYKWLPCKRDFEGEMLSGWIREPEMRCIARGNGTLNVLVMGNSISYRAYPRIHRIFNGRYDKLRLFSKSSQPAVFSVAGSKAYEDAANRLIRKMKPDVLFIIFASLNGEGAAMKAPVLNYTNDSAMLHLQKNFDHYSKFTRRIVVELPYYTSSTGYLREINKRLKLGKKLEDLKITRKDLDKQMHWQHERLRHVNCSTCILNDVSQAMFNGSDTFYFYDRNTYYSYYHDGIHLTHPGLDLLTDMYTKTIERVIKELT